MNKIKKLITGLFMSGCLLANGNFAANAAMNAKSIDYWDINYAPGAPGDISNEMDQLELDYYSNGYIAYCSTISGVNGRSLYISAPSNQAGGMPKIDVTTTGYTKTWKMYGSSTKPITINVMATAGYQCQSTGYIRINN